MLAEVEGAPQPGSYYRAVVDGRETVVRVVTCSDMTVVCNPTEGPQRVIDRAAILGEADDPYAEEPGAAGEVVTDYFAPQDQMPVAVEPGAAVVLEALTADEVFELQALEAEASEAFDAIRESGYEAGRALREISEQRLYRSTHATFEDYCRERWEIGRAQAYSLMDFAKVRNTLSARADIKALPESAKQVRELKYAGDLAPEAWFLAVERKGGEQPTSREVAQAADETVHDYQGRQVDEEVWWIEADTERLRAGVIERLWRGEAVVLPTDGGGPLQAFPLPLGRLGVGPIPGKPTPYGFCGLPLDGDAACSEPASDRDQPCAEHRRAADETRAQLNQVTALQAQARDQAEGQGHNLGPWETNGQSTLILGAKCQACGGGVSLFGNENPPNLSTSPKLQTRCEMVPVKAADGRVDPETAPLETAADVKAVLDTIRGMPAGDVLTCYSRVLRTSEPDTLRRADILRADLDRRRGSVDLPRCHTHGDYSPCLECERAAVRVEELAETAGMPEIAGELKTAAGLSPDAPAGYTSGQGIAWRLGRKAAEQNGPFNPPQNDFRAPWVAGWTTLLPVPEAVTTPPAQDPEPAKPNALKSAEELVSERGEAAGQAPTVIPTTVSALPLDAPVRMCMVTVDCADWIASSGLVTKDFLFALKGLAYNRGLDAAGVLALLETNN